MERKRILPFLLALLLLLGLAGCSGRDKPDSSASLPEESQPQEYPISIGDETDRKSTRLNSSHWS